MGTRSTIALEFADGTVQQVYCHWDGYVSHNGKILFENYSDPFKLRDLIRLGDMSSLRKEIGVQHPFDNPGSFGDAKFTAFKEAYGNMCTFYGRDRGEESTGAKKFANYQDYIDNHQYEEYEYILRTDGKWYVKGYHFDYIELNAELLDGAE